VTAQVSQPYKTAGKIINRSQLLRSCNVDDRPIKYMWSIGGMKWTGKNRNTWRKSHPSATSSAKNQIRTGLGLNPVASRRQTDRIIYPWHSS